MFLVALSFAYFAKALSGSYMKSTITQLERRFDIPSYLIGVIDGSFEMGKNRIFMRQQTFRCVSIPSPPPSSCQGSRLSAKKYWDAPCVLQFTPVIVCSAVVPQIGQKQLQTR